MSVVQSKHDEAMDLAEQALLARIHGSLPEALALFQEALSAELAAIAALSDTDPVEPTYSVLHRSAATLALDCNDPRKAEQLAAAALAHSPPNEIAEELRDLLEQIHFHRHLLLRGVTLGENEMQMSLAGPGVGYGVVSSQALLERVSGAAKAIYRIVERRSGEAFREEGSQKRDLLNEYAVFVSVPRAASFAVTLRLGQPSKQPALPGLLSTVEVLDEFTDLMDLVNRSRTDELRARIPDKAYYRNFVALAKRMAPDGVNVRQVGFTTVRGGTDRTVAITRPRPDFAEPASDAPGGPLPRLTVKGVLRFADATHGGRGMIKVVADGGESHDVRVPEGMMNDIVRPLWDSVVIVTGQKKGRYLLLEEINPEPGP